MVRNIHTSRKSSSRARMAGKVLRDPEASKASKSVAGSLLSEAKPAAKKRAEKKAEEKAEGKPKKEAKPKTRKE